MSTFYLIRHGNKQRGVSDPELTQLGQKQAQKTGLFLKQFPISKIFSSPMNRTQQTAQQIATALSLPVKTDSRLKERMERPLEISKEEFVGEWAKTTHDRTYSPQHGDSSRKTGERMENIIQEIAADPAEHVALITHGGALVDFLRNVFNENQVKKLLKQLPGRQDYVIDECSITQVKFENGSYTLVDLHFTSHLE